MYVFRRRTRLEIWTPAKLNLFLEVWARRADGFHEIETLMTPISLFDTVRLERRADDRCRLVARWDLGSQPAQSSIDAVEPIPTGPANLIIRALERLRERAGIAWGMDVELIKRIPMAAGLGGGSSDAAAALLGANEVWDLGWSREQLAEIAAELGSDVPFFLYGGSAICRGRGERIEALNHGPRSSWVIVRPEFGLSTAAIYGRVKVPQTPRSLNGIMEAWQERRLPKLGQQLFNRLQEAGLQSTDRLAAIMDAFQRVDVLGYQMSGSGSCCFGMCRNANHARRVARVLQARGLGRVYHATSVMTMQQAL